ncbi:MAG: hypothetical protein SGILL_002178, partial [Bacillariaceae sp.]
MLVERRTELQITPEIPYSRDPLVVELCESIMNRANAKNGQAANDSHSTLDTEFSLECDSPFSCKVRKLDVDEELIPASPLAKDENE